MAIPDKAPDTPSRMRLPTARGMDEDEEENKTDIGNKRKASEMAPAIKRTASMKITAPPPFKVSSLSNPRIPATINNPKATIAAPPIQPIVMRDNSLNQRLEDMERITKELQGKIAESSGGTSTIFTQLQLAELKCAELEAHKHQLESRLADTEKECRELTNELDDQKRKLRILQEESDLALNRVKSAILVDLETVQRERDVLKRDLEQNIGSLSIANAELAALREPLSRQSATIIDMETQITALKTKLESVEREAKERACLLQQSTETVCKLNEEVKTLHDKLVAGEKARRRLHNSLQELKGNIRVFCRVRPILPNEVPGAVKVPGGHGIGDPEDIIIEQQTEGATGTASVKQHPFLFDRVFGSETSQAIVFEEIEQLVQSALDGYRVCIFAYGQTGSGKTFTMEGRPDSSELLGVIPRAVHQIFQHASFLKERGWFFAFEVSFLEIYNETIRDLLNERENREPIAHEIRHSAGNKTLVTDLTVLTVDNVGSVLNLLQIAGKNRAVAETLCNDRSSRSHSVFTLRISGGNGNETVEGLLNLIDLAGSERLSSSGSTGDRLKETQAINKSLSALGDAIAAIAAKEQHVPFRNSKLTYLLQNSLGGNCKTLMFVNVSPAAPSVPETLCSLRFATKANFCHIGTARRNAK